MGLMNLLTVGRSLSEARNRPHRYKLMNGALPTFGNPPGPVLEKSFEVGTRAAPQRNDGQLETRKLETQSMSTDMSDVKAAAPAESGAGWVAKVNPFRPARPAASRRVVQGELSLDKVKPVRNDLSDSDLELVARRPEPMLSVQKLQASDSLFARRISWRDRIYALFRRSK